jgi:hypothetical protein
LGLRLLLRLRVLRLRQRLLLLPAQRAGLREVEVVAHCHTV